VFVRNRSIFLLRDRLVHRRVEELSGRLDPRHSVLRENPLQLPLHELDALQHALEVPGLAATCMVHGAVQVIDRRQQILDEILVAVAVRFLALAQVRRRKLSKSAARRQRSSAPRSLELGAEPLDLHPKLLVLLGGELDALPDPHALARGTPTRRLRALDGRGGLAQRLLELGARREASEGRLLLEGLSASGAPGGLPAGSCASFP
jgi:hypothetical protein